MVRDTRPPTSWILVSQAESTSARDSPTRTASCSWGGGGQGRGGDVKTGGESTWWRVQHQTQVSLHCTLPLWPHLQVAGSSLRRLLGGMREVIGSVLRTRHIVVALPADPASNYAESRVGWFSFLSPTLPACSILSRLIRSCCYLKSPTEHRSGHCRGRGDKRHTHTHTLLPAAVC